ncbi:hypothetical protein NQ314_020646 [Rhamnusium bicolor]|uniref:Uncharacterized protein n=1 Tax=Rhamnusium bicolor TaxID=1586634 RepID=A0AAV8WJ31_9CUCU|nr:hypothetical protein NQ314_020646 [Rhamnusium bicolor]
MLLSETTAEKSLNEKEGEEKNEGKCSKVTVGCSFTDIVHIHIVYVYLDFVAMINDRKLIAYIKNVFVGWNLRKVGRTP